MNKNNIDVKDYIALLDAQTAKGAQELVEIMQNVSGCEPKFYNQGTK